MPKLKIEHLGPVEKLEFDVKDFNLIIGEQATGKSTIAKSVYFFRVIKDSIIKYLCDIYTDRSDKTNIIVDMRRNMKFLFVSIFGYSWDQDNRLFLSYEYTNDIRIDISLHSKRKYINAFFTNELKHQLFELEKKVKNLPAEDNNENFNFFTDISKKVFAAIKKSVNEIFDDDRKTYYIPAGRCLLTLLSNQKTSIDYQNLDMITYNYMQEIERIHKLFSEGIREVYKMFPVNERKFDVHKVAEFLIDCIKGDYRYSHGNERLELSNNSDNKTSVKINFASSGQQEVLWLLNELYVLLLREEKSFVIIEEPEAHLYPVLQKNIIDFIAFFVKMNNSSVLVTTHSPYVMTSVNTLYYAGDCINNCPQNQKQILNMLPLRAEINPDSFNAVKLKQNNEIENLIDDDMNELRTEMIDEISDQINGIYTELFYLRNSQGEE